MPPPRTPRPAHTTPRAATPRRPALRPPHLPCAPLAARRLAQRVHATARDDELGGRRAAAPLPEVLRLARVCHRALAGGAGGDGVPPAARAGRQGLRRERPMERASRDTPSPLDSPQRRSWPREMAREMAMTISRDCRSPAVHHQSQSRDGPSTLDPPSPSLPAPQASASTRGTAMAARPTQAPPGMRTRDASGRVVDMSSWPPQASSPPTSSSATSSKGAHTRRPPPRATQRRAVRHKHAARLVRRRRRSNGSCRGALLASAGDTWSLRHEKKQKYRVGLASTGTNVNVYPAIVRLRAAVSNETFLAEARRAGHALAGRGARSQ